MNAFKQTVIALIVSAAAGSAVAGAVNGPQSTTTQVGANTTDSFNVRFLEGELARVSLRGDGDTDLDLIIKDRFGNVVCRAVGPTDVEVCRFVPDETARYRIEVRNLGGVYNEYRLATN
jgi:hypothetical protein